MPSSDTDKKYVKEEYLNTAHTIQGRDPIWIKEESDICTKRIITKYTCAFLSIQKNRIVVIIIITVLPTLCCIYVKINVKVKVHPRKGLKVPEGE